MIAQYNGGYFQVDTTVRPMNLWAYQPVSGFARKVTRRGTVYYEKAVPEDQISEIFEAGFSVEWKGVRFFCLPDVREKTVELRTSNRELAEKFGFLVEDEDRGRAILWSRTVGLEECAQFRFHKTVYRPEYFTKRKNDAKTEYVELMPVKAWLDIHVKTVDELSPWNYK